MKSTKVVFNHSESLTIDKAMIEFTLPSGSIVRRDVTSEMNENRGVFSFGVIDDIKLSGITNNFTKGAIGLKYIFDTSFCVDSSNSQTIKYTFETKRTIDSTNFLFQTKLTTMEISAIVHNNSSSSFVA